MGTSYRLDRAFSQAPVLPLSSRSKYVLVSDCHRGVGTSSDNFLKNQHDDLVEAEKTLEGIIEELDTAIIIETALATLN